MIPLQSILQNWNLCVGIGLGMCVGFVLSNIFEPRNEKQAKNVEEDESDWTDADDSDDELDLDETKLVLVVRNDLKMGKGKAAAQCCHATLSAYKKASRRKPNILKSWERSGQRKVVVKTDSMDDINLLHQNAINADLINCVIHDAGKTQIEAGSLTVLAIGPDISDKIDEVAGHLKLF